MYGSLRDVTTERNFQNVKSLRCHFHLALLRMEEEEVFSLSTHFDTFAARKRIFNALCPIFMKSRAVK